LSSCNNTTAFVPTITSSLGFAQLQPSHHAKIVQVRRARQRLASAPTNRSPRSPPERRSPLVLELKPLFTRVLPPKKVMSHLQKPEPSSYGLRRWQEHKARIRSDQAVRRSPTSAADSHVQFSQATITGQLWRTSTCMRDTTCTITNATAC
jgi:hypothetical protein